jgi:molybdopterin-binding protein
MVTEGKPDEALGQPDPLGWKNSVGPMNLLRVEELTSRDGHWVARVGDQTLNLACREVKPAPPVFVQFAPADVTLSRQDVAGVSVRNQLRGQVRQLVNVPDGVFVAVDVGQILWSEVTREAADELALAPGVGVTCLIKTYRIDVL